MEEKRIAKEKAEKAANKMQKMAKAATVIQVVISSSYIDSWKGVFSNPISYHGIRIVDMNVWQASDILFQVLK